MTAAKSLCSYGSSSSPTSSPSVAQARTTESRLATATALHWCASARPTPQSYEVRRRATAWMGAFLRSADRMVWPPFVAVCRTRAIHSYVHKLRDLKPGGTLYKWDTGPKKAVKHTCNTCSFLLRRLPPGPPAARVLGHRFQHRVQLSDPGLLPI